MRLTYSFCALENVVNSNFLTADVPDVRIKLYKFGSYIIFILEKEGFSQVVSNSFLLSFLFIYLFIYLLVPFRRNRRGIAAKCSQIEKILRGRKQFPRRRFEDDLYTYSGVVSVIAYTFYLSAHVPRFLRFLGGNIDGNAPGTFPLENRRNYFSKRGKHR